MSSKKKHFTVTTAVTDTTSSSKKPRLKRSSVEQIGNSIFLRISDPATKRVIAPYVSIIRKGWKAAPPQIRKVPSLTSLIGKKPSVLLKKFSQFLYDNVDLSVLLRDTANCMKSITKATGETVHFLLCFTTSPRFALSCTASYSF